MVTKKIIISILGILLVATFVISASIREVDINDIYADKINAINEDPIMRSNITCQGLDGALDRVYYCRQLVSKGDYTIVNIHTEATVYNGSEYILRSDADIIGNLSLELEKRLIIIAQKTIRAERGDIAIEDDGEITLT